MVSAGDVGKEDFHLVFCLGPKTAGVVTLSHYFLPMFF